MVLAALVVGGLGAVLTSTAVAGAPHPVLGRTIVVTPLSGTVLVGQRGRGFVRLKGRLVVPVGSTVDASRGKARVLAAGGAGVGTQSGTFNGGAFVVTQSGSGLVDLSLVGKRGKPLVCPAHAGALAFAAKKYSNTGGKNGPAHVSSNRMRTKGNHGSASASGSSSGKGARVAGARAAGAGRAVWTIEDRCDRTSISDQAGTVSTAYSNAEGGETLEPHQSIVYRCDVTAFPFYPYCEYLLSFGSHTKYPVYRADLSTKFPTERYDLCIKGPTRQTVCTPYPLSSQGVRGERASLVVCSPDEGTGRYEITWWAAGIKLGAPLTYDAHVPRSATSQCLSGFGKRVEGGNKAPFPADFKFVNRYALTTTGKFSYLWMYLFPTGQPGQQVLKGVVYADSNGAPGALVDTTKEFTFHSTQAAGFYELPFPKELQHPAGHYWIGVVSGAGSGVVGYSADSVPGVRDLNANLYAAGPTSAFGPITTDDAQMTLELVYFVVPRYGF